MEIYDSNCQPDMGPRLERGCSLGHVLSLDIVTVSTPACKGRGPGSLIIERAIQQTFFFFACPNSDLKQSSAVKIAKEGDHNLQK